MPTALVLLAIWLLLNILFVVMMTPPRKPQTSEPTSGGGLRPLPIPAEDDE